MSYVMCFAFCNNIYMDILVIKPFEEMERSYDPYNLYDKR